MSRLEVKKTPALGGKWAGYDGGIDAQDRAVFVGEMLGIHLHYNDIHA